MTRGNISSTPGWERSATLCRRQHGGMGSEGTSPSPCMAKHAPGQEKKQTETLCFSSAAGHACLHPMLRAVALNPALASGGRIGISLHVQGPTESGKANACDSTYILNWKIPINYDFVGRLPMGKNFTDARATSYSIPSFYASKTGQMIW